MSSGWPRRLQRSGPLRETFTAHSADDGYYFQLEVEGRWEERARTPHRNPESVAATHVIELVRSLACSIPLLERERLQHQANSVLGQPVNVPDHSLRLLWAQVRVYANPDDVDDLLDAQRHRHALRRAAEAKRVKIEHIAAFRDSLREDPTLALAQMLLETPTAITHETIENLELVTQRVAANSPRVKTIVIAQLLRDFVAGLKPDAKQLIVDRLCTALVEFGGHEQAEKIRATLHTDD